MRERPRTERLRPRPVGGRPGHQLGRPAHDLVASQRIARVGRELGLDADDACLGPERPDRRRDPARQPAATDRDEDDRDIRQVLDELEPDRPLAGDDPIVVERRDDLEPALGCELLGHLLALVAGRADDHDLGAVGRHPLALDRRRVGGHHDHGRRPQQASRSSDALGMVARRVGDDAAPALLRGQGRDRGVGASQLERPDRLEGFGLQEPSLLGRSERHERRAGRDAAQAVGRRTDVLDAHQPHGRTRLHQRSRSAIRWQSMQRGAQGNASSRSTAIGRPHRTHAPNVPASSRARASSTSSSW